MKPVNLLPPAERPRAVAAAPANASIVVLAVLGALLVGVVGYVFTKNQITDRNAAIAQATQEKSQAEQRASGLKAFGDFSQIKQTRVESVTQLASKRFDWERLMRELALVLPDKVWLTEVTAGAAGDASASAGATASSAAPAASAAGTTPGAGGPSVMVKGCAPSQKAVAETIVRMRSLYGADDVELQDSAVPQQGASSGGTSDSSSEGAGCGKRYQFTSTVTFKAPDSTPAPKPAAVPSRLGGGA